MEAVRLVAAAEAAAALAADRMVDEVEAVRLVVLLIVAALAYHLHRRDIIMVWTLVTFYLAA